jgi:hypothetical protein
VLPGPVGPALAGAGEGGRPEGAAAAARECRRPGTRYEEPAVGYVASWMVAMIEKDLRLLGPSGRP